MPYSDGSYKIGKLNAFWIDFSEATRSHHLWPGRKEPPRDLPGGAQRTEREMGCSRLFPGSEWTEAAW